MYASLSEIYSETEEFYLEKKIPEESALDQRPQSVIVWGMPKRGQNLSSNMKNVISNVLFHIMIRLLMHYHYLDDYFSII